MTKRLKPPIFIQQNYARTHIKYDDIEFLQRAKKDEFNIALMCQPIHFSYLNVLDIDFILLLYNHYYNIRNHLRLASGP